MKATLCASRADVEEPSELGAFLDLGKAPQIAVDRIGLAATSFHRCQQQPARPPTPAKDLVAAAIGRPRQTRDYHRVELQAFRAMQRHHLNARAIAHVSL